MDITTGWIVHHGTAIRIHKIDHVYDECNGTTTVRVNGYPVNIGLSFDEVIAKIDEYEKSW